ncbi:hypothetical protein [Micromonospora sp. SL4-19]|uniref:hypothetical protein n=1 Tax=Micromonospora sp. SL4-19 TaxID=3399129 RepID=UPI003A4D5A1B
MVLSSDRMVDAGAVTQFVAAPPVDGGIPTSALAVGAVLLFGSCWFLIPNWWRSGLKGDVFFTDHLNRAFLANVMFLTCLTLAVVLIAAEEHSWISVDAAKILIIPIGVAAVLSALSIGTIYAFNWPEFLVPPRMRSQPGRFKGPS